MGVTGSALKTVPERKSFFRIIKNGSLGEEYTRWVALAELQSGRVRTVAFEKTDNYSSTKIDGERYITSER